LNFNSPKPTRIVCHENPSRPKNITALFTPKRSKKSGRTSKFPLRFDENSDSCPVVCWAQISHPGDLTGKKDQRFDLQMLRFGEEHVTFTE
jgi:hypothetical protein